MSPEPKTKISMQIFKNPFLYVRWAFFVGYLGFFFTANSIVAKENISMVILLNYLWPTGIIIFSVFLNGVKVTRKFVFFLWSYGCFCKFVI